MRALAFGLLLACGFDTPAGQPSPNTVGERTTSTTGAPSSVTSSTALPSTTDEDTSTGPAPTTETPDTSSSSSDSGEPDCSGEQTLVADFAQEDLVDPMALSFASDPVGVYAYSEEEGEGAVAVAFEIECGGEYILWALVHDEDTEPFDDGGNADAYAVRVDGGEEREWSYGCTTFFQVDPWSYERVGLATVLNCGVQEDVTYALNAGFHTATFTNLEAGSHGGNNPGSVAAIARITLTTDPDYIPDPDLE